MPWKAGAGSRPRTGNKSIRGQISGPIPIPDPLDDEFPMRDPGSSMATPLGGDGLAANKTAADLQPQEHDQPPHVAESVPASRSRTETTGSSHDEIEAFLNTTPSKSRSASSQRGSPKRVTKRTRDHRVSVVSSHTAQSSGTRDVPQRKKSTFRSALSRLFGRKKKKNSLTGTTDSTGRSTPAAASNGHHRSDPTVRVSSLKIVEPQRSTSLPITEYDRALRSHSVGPEDVMAIQSARNSINADTRLSGTRAGDFAAAITRPAGPRWTGGRKFTGLSPRPASSHGGTRLADYSEDPNEIGRAITSDAQGLRRRSRSLSAFPVTESVISGVVRRRSDEIRHWRESYDPPIMSPVSSSMPDVEDVGVLVVDERDTVVEEPPRTPVVPFTFEDVRTMKEVAGLKITEAASLDSRICSLETRMSQLELLVSRLSNSAPAFGSHYDPPSRTPPSIPVKDPEATPHRLSPYRSGNEGNGSPSRPSTRHSDASKMTFGDGPSYPETAPQVPVHLTESSSNRPISTATIRGISSLPSIPKEMSQTLTMDHYMTLMALLGTERSAREALEAQVKKLGHQMALMNRLPAYSHPTQSEAASVDRSTGETSVFDHDDDDEDDGGIHGRRRSRLDLRLADSNSSLRGQDDDECSESFATPNEDGRDLDAFGDEQGATLKSAARALSLSRLTLGPPPDGMPQVQPQAI